MTETYFEEGGSFNTFGIDKMNKKLFKKQIITQYLVPIYRSSLKIRYCQYLIILKLMLMV